MSAVAVANSASSPGIAEGAALNPELWKQFRDAATPQAYAQSWLALQCLMIPDAVRAVVMIGVRQGAPFVPLAFWPDDSAGTDGLTAVAERAMAEHSGVVHAHESSGPGYDVAYPVLVDGQLCAVAAIEIRGRPESQLPAVMRQLQWGSAWLEIAIRRERAPQGSVAHERLSTVLALVATCLEHESFQAAATATTTELATLLACDRVSVGFPRGKHVRVCALSHSAQIGKQTNLMRAIGAAMDEALDQQATIVYPETAGAAVHLMQTHAALARHHGVGTICTVPLVHEGRTLGALTFERTAERGFDASTLEVCEAAAALVGPVLELKRRDDRWLHERLWESTRRQVRDLVGPQHAGLKLGGMLIAIAIAVCAVARGDYRVTANATLEGTIQRSLVAPMNGYVASAQVRAGDVVKEGGVLCTLDDRDLQLERLKWVSQQERFTREHREALAKEDRAQVSIARAQIDQAEAQLALVEEQLRRLRIVAPFDGIVVSGDLSQSLGAPVERGQVLFEIAPLNSYRIILKVDEREIADVAIGQHGQLALSAMAGDVLPFTIDKITPVATAEEGQNVFRVEASLQDALPTLRPGLQGIGKIDIDRRRLLWIWTAKIVNRVRLLLWSWWP